MKQYCCITPDGEKTCHVFDNGVYQGFQVDGEWTNQYGLVAERIRLECKEEELAPWLQNAGFLPE